MKKFIVLLLPLLLVALPAAAQYGMMDRENVGVGGSMTGWGGMMGNGFGLWNGLVVLMFVVWLVAGILLIVWLWEQIKKK